MDAGTLREAIHRVYGCLKRNKALPDNRGISVAIVDGHESHASYRRHCSGCLERTIHAEQGDRIQYYHRQVTLLLVTDAPPGRQPLRLPLDHEPQLPNEDEVATAMRLLKRVLARYPRAFDLVLADALYTRADFFNFLLDHRKHALVVLKDERRNLYQDVAGLFDSVAPVPGAYRSRDCHWWDLGDLISWPEVKIPVRVIRSLETYSVRRQLSKKDELQTSDWVWVTTLPSTQVSVARAVGFGHQRWDIENHGFNELVEGWHADHVLKHDQRPHRMLPAPDVSRFHHFSCLSLSQREASPAQGQVQSLLDQSHGSGNLQVRWSPPACRPEVFRSLRPILLLAPGIFIAIFLLVEPSNGVANSVPPSKKPCELAVPSVACPKMLKTSINLPILTFFRSSIGNRWQGRQGRRAELRLTRCERGLGLRAKGKLKAEVPRQPCNS